MIFNSILLERRVKVGGRGKSLFPQSSFLSLSLSLLCTAFLHIRNGLMAVHAGYQRQRKRKEKRTLKQCLQYTDNLKKADMMTGEGSSL